MKGLIYTGTQEVEIRDVPDPQVGAEEVLLRVEAAGICGGDMHAYFGHDPRRVPPMILGHEVAGVVEKGKQFGERVLANPFISCGGCRYCKTGRSNICPNRKLIGMNLPGSFAKYVRVPEKNLLLVPAGIESRVAVLAEPLAASVHAFDLISRAWCCTLEEAKVLVLGGGAVGLTAALLLKHMNVVELLLGETNAGRRASAGAAGIPVYDPSAMEAPARYFDIIFDAVGSGATRASALAAVADGGFILHTGLQDNDGAIDMRRVTLCEISVIGTYAYTQTNLAAALKAIHEGVLGSMAWVDYRPMADGAEAFAELAEGRSSAAKIVLEP